MREPSVDDCPFVKQVIFNLHFNKWVNFRITHAKDYQQESLLKNNQIITTDRASNNFFQS